MHPGSKTMAFMEKDSRNLGDPTCSQRRKPTGTPTQSKKRMTDGKWGVGLVHSTPRTGEPFTWGRDQQTYVARKGNMDRTAGLEITMQTSLWGIAEKAKQNKHYRFGNLYGLLNESALYCAWKGLKKKAAAGVDKETARTFSKDLTANLDTLVEELRSKQYKARLVKQVGIPKGNGKLRMLGLPALRDKIVQKAVADILSAIYEQDFLKCSYGYRPKVGAQMAVRDVTKELMKRYSYVVEADIKVITSW